MSRIRTTLASFDRVLVGFVLGGLAWLVFYTVLTIAGKNSPDLALFVDNVLYLVPIAGAVALCSYAVSRTRQRVRLAWRLLLVSNILWLTGEAIWGVYAYASPTGAPVPSVADAAYLSSYVLALPAMVIGLGLRVRGLLDALLLVAGGAAIGWQIMVGPLVPKTWNPAALVTFLYPVFSVSIASILVAVLLTGSQRVPRSMIIVGAAFGLGATMDAAYAYLSVVDDYTSSSWLNLGWQAEAVLLCIAALVAGRWPEAEERRILEPDLSFLPAMVAVFTVGGLALADLLLVGQLGRVTLAVTLLLLVGLLVRQVVSTRDRSRLAHRLREDAITDPLTSLYNRRFFEEVLQVEAGYAARRHTPLSLILLDLDHFKQVNDTYGHPVGDAVLAEVGQRLRSCLRGSDVICRYGGEEFVCLMPRTDGQTALDLAERIRSALSRTPVTVPGGPDLIRLSASIGVASVEPDESGYIDLDGFIDAADQAVYRAKALGRDRIIGSGSLTQQSIDPARDLPPGLVWLADQIAGALGDRGYGAAVSRWALTTAARLELDETAQHSIAAAARVHDIGKISLLRTPPITLDRADPCERQDARAHPQEGARLLAVLADRPDLARLIAAHHERYDGSGYPDGLAGADIPIGARIIAVCDAWATIRTDSLPSPVPTMAESRHELAEGRGTRFDPAVLDAFLSLLDGGEIDEPVPVHQPAPRVPSASSA